jgi:DNA-binding FadR family transcriptional regulator
MTAMRPTKLLGGTRKRNLFAHVADELGTRIVNGDLRPGQPFPIEAELGQEYGASRSVIREAVKSLAAKGLLESRTRTGIRVLPPQQWNLFDTDVLEWRYTAMEPHEFFRELFEIRHMIEPEAAWLAAERATDEEIVAIETAFTAMETAKPGTDDAIAADLAFHRQILAAAHNALLLQMGSLIGVGLLVSYRISNDPFTVFLSRHHDVAIAIKKHKPAQARKAMDALLTGTKEFLESRIKAPRRR